MPNDRRHAWAKYELDEELGAGAFMLAQIGLDDVPRFRETWDAISAHARTPLPPTVSVTHASAPASDHEIPLTVYRHSNATRDSPAILLIHSGAFVGGSTRSVHAQAGQLSNELECVVVSVEYRLAPEFPYPHGLDDCYRTLEWMVENAIELGINPARVALHGTSAGGALAVAIALRARDTDGPNVRCLVLNSPELDDRLATDSMRRFGDTPGFTNADAKLSWAYYLGEVAPGSDEVPALAAPARATDLSGLPPTYLAIMEFDPLRDEGLQFAQRLLAAGVSLELHLFPGTFHGSSALAYAEVSKRETQEEITVLRRRLAH